jgi:hypothetical protein
MFPGRGPAHSRLDFNDDPVERMAMKLVAFTIVLDGMPFLPAQFAMFNRLRDLDWHWIIVEGAAENSGSTKWCRPQTPRLSQDGTTQFLNSLKSHPRITVIQRQWWVGGKDAMVNTALETIKEPCVLLQLDMDEFWESVQAQKIYQLLADDFFDCARFFCRYFVGPNIIATGESDWGNRPGEFLRAWRFSPGMKMTHEPPRLHGVNGPNERCLSRENSREFGLVFDHYAYVLQQQVAYKEEFYGYSNAVAYWQHLQRNRTWPLKRLRGFLPWVGEGTGADLLHK